MMTLFLSSLQFEILHVFRAFATLAATAFVERPFILIAFPRIDPVLFSLFGQKVVVVFCEFISPMPQ